MAVDKITLDKITWDRVGRVTEPGRYMYKFGWLTITAQELEVWQRFPNAAFTLYRPSVAETEDDFRLGAFELPEGHSSGERVAIASLTPWYA